MTNHNTFTATRLSGAGPARFKATVTAMLLGLLPANAADWIAPSRGLTEVTHDKVTLQGGFWGPRQETHLKTTIPHALDKLEERNHVTNFDIAARVVEGGTTGQGAADTGEATKALEGNAGNRDAESEAGSDDEIVGHSAFDSDVHKALEGACYTLGHADDPALRKRVEGILDRILAAQEDDGYLISYFTAKEPDQKWANMRLNHEMYNAGHFFEFAVEHQRLTGDSRAVDAARRFADHIDGIFGPGKRYEVGGHQGIELALIKLYRATGEKRYLELCRFLLDERGHAHGTERKPFTEVIPRGDPKREPGQTVREWRRGKWSMRNGRMQDHKPLLDQDRGGRPRGAGRLHLFGHGRHRALQRRTRATRAAEKLWQDVVGRKMYVNGGIGTAQYGDEGFGDPYLLPNRTYCESCSSIAHVFWQHRMNLLKGEAKYADVMELVLYNAALSGMSLSGDSFFYQNPLESRKGASVGSGSAWPAARPISAASPRRSAGMSTPRGNRLYVNLFARGEAESTWMARAGEDHPGDELPVGREGQADLVNARESEFELCLRIPGWARGKPVPERPLPVCGPGDEARHRDCRRAKRSTRRRRGRLRAPEPFMESRATWWNSTCRCRSAVSTPMRRSRRPRGRWR
jgi:DUF1680 family protein